MDGFRSTCGIVGVVGEAPESSFLDVGAELFNEELASESPRAGRSTCGLCWVEPKDELDVVDKSSRVVSTGAEGFTIASMGGLASLPARSAAGEPCDGERAMEFLRASALLLLGTSWSLKASDDCEGAGDACWLRVRSAATAGDSLVLSLRFRSVSTSCSEGCLPFSWYAIWGLVGCRSADADRDLFSLSISLWLPVGRLK